MKKIKILLFASIPFLLAACGSSSSKDKDTVQVADSTNEAKSDRADSAGTFKVDEATSDFLVKAANGGMAEVKMGELAKQKAVNAKVKSMGEMMVMDHSAGNQEVKSLASTLNVTLPADINDDMQKAYNDLSAKSGRDFDKAYVKQMITDHENVIDLFKKADNNVKDANVRTFANNTLPKLQMHLDSFKAIQKIIK